MDLSFLKNRFAEVFYKGKPVTVYIKEVKEKRIHLLLPSGKEELINHSALIYFEEKLQNLKDLNQILSFIKEKHEKREKLKHKFELQEVWEVLEEEVDEISAREVAELILNRNPEEDEIASLMRKIVEDKIYFKLKEPNKLKVMSREEVERILHQRKKEIEKLKKINEGMEFIKAFQAGSINSYSEEVKNFWISALKEYVLWEDKTSLGKLVLEVLQRLNMANQYKIFELLVKRGVFKEDENLELIKTHYPTNFTDKEILEAKNIYFKINEDKREDLTDLYTFTIDAEETQDFDDALSFEETEKEYILYIHITEVAGFVNPGSALWEGALERACTLYLPDEIYPMFPFSLSHEKFSLKKGETKPALTFKIRIDKNLNIIEFKPFLSLIKVKDRFTYEEVDDFLLKDEFWQKLYSLLMHFKEKREKRGALAVFLPEIQIKVDKNGKITLKKIEMTPSRNLVAEAMILGNTLSAQFLHENNIPAIYRFQSKPVEIIEDREKSLYLKLLQLKYLPKSELSLEPAYHSGLGLDYYTTLTSPIRRFLDLLIQYQLRSFLLGKPFLSKDILIKIMPELSENLKRALQIQNKRIKYFLLKYFKLYEKDKFFKGIILDIHQRKAKVYLIDYNITGEIINLKKHYSPGEEIMVKLEKVHPHLEVLRLKEI